MRPSVPDRDPDCDPTAAGLNQIDGALARAGKAILPQAEQRARAIFLAALFAAALLVLVVVGAYASAGVGYDRSAAHTDRRIAALESDLTERRQVRASQDAGRDAQTRELLALVCVLLDRAQPRDSEVQARRVRYGCVAPVPPPPSVSPR